MNKKIISIVLAFIMLFTALSSTFVVNAATKNTVKTSITKVESKAKGFKVTWNKKSKIKGYQIQYSTSSKFKNASKKTMSKSSTRTATISKLSGCNKKYYVRVRTYKTSNGKKIYSSWSKTKSVKTLAHNYNNGACKYCKKVKSSSQTQNSQNVFITQTGKKYHSSRSCRGLSNANAIYETTLSDAQSTGLSPCSWCH